MYSISHLRVDGVFHFLGPPYIYNVCMYVLSHMYNSTSEEIGLTHNRHTIKPSIIDLLRYVCTVLHNRTPEASVLRIYCAI